MEVGDVFGRDDDVSVRRKEDEPAADKSRCGLQLMLKGNLI